MTRPDIDMSVVRWAKQHDWFRSWETNDKGHVLIWCNDGTDIHPWPFNNYAELRAWAGY